MNTEASPFPNDPSERRHVAERRVCANEPSVDPERRSADDRRSSGLHAIARSFGLSPEHLEAVDHDEAMEGAMGDAGHCPNCESMTQKCSELEAQLAESRKEIERYRNRTGKSRRKRGGS